VVPAGYSGLKAGILEILGLGGVTPQSLNQIKLLDFLIAKKRTVAENYWDRFIFL
jgi:hypothetical protein